jgi:hypothetical protein
MKIYELINILEEIHKTGHPKKEEQKSLRDRRKS